MWKGELVFIGEALVGEFVGIAELETGDYVVRFCDLDIGLIDRCGRFGRFAPPRPGLREPAKPPANQNLSGLMRSKMSTISPVEHRRGATPLTRPASRSLSSGAHSRDPLASPDDLAPQKELGEVRKQAPDLPTQPGNRRAPRPLIVRWPSPSVKGPSRAGLEPATLEKIMFIQTEATPNPATLKFIPGRLVLDGGTMEFVDREAAARSPLAERLFDVSGVASVFYGSDFITVTKNDGDWQHLKPAILGAIMEHYMSGAPLLADGTAASDEAADEKDEFFREEDAETVEMIKDLIETRVRPAVANDGGDITFRGFKDGIVYLNMKGSCAGCPSSTATLQHGIQNLLRHFVPDVVEVRPM
jgi:Fe-S cluster biogenesis protein NfuA